MSESNRGAYANAIPLGRDGTFTDLYSNSRNKRLLRGRQRRRRSSTRSPTPLRTRDRDEVEDDDRRPTKLTKPTVELEIKGVIEASQSIYGQSFVIGFCHGFYGSVTINLSEFRLELNPDYSVVFDKYCCKGKRRHVIINRKI
jgi:hypothetical protein